MKKVEELIQKVKDGKVAILNDGTVEQLREVLLACFPLESCEVNPIFKYFYAGFEKKWTWYCNTQTSLPTVSVKEFYKYEVKTAEEFFDKYFHPQTKDKEFIIQKMKEYATQTNNVKNEDEFVWNDFKVYDACYFVGLNIKGNEDIQKQIPSLVLEFKSQKETVPVEKMDEFVWGEEVEVKDYKIWENAKFIGKNPNAISDMNICITFRNTIVNIGMSNIRKSPTKLKLTHQMIADKFGVVLGTFEIIN